MSASKRLYEEVQEQERLREEQECDEINPAEYEAAKLLEEQMIEKFAK